MQVTYLYEPTQTCTINSTKSPGVILMCGNDSKGNTYLVRFNNGSRWFAEAAITGEPKPVMTPKPKAEYV